MGRRVCVVIAAILLFSIADHVIGQSRPHIVFIVADDLGWNDVGFHNPEMKTPNIDKLSYSGLILNQSYVQPVCSPSRNSWMSGFYPFKSGLQHRTIKPEQPVCSPLNRTLLPQKLKDLGYATHMVGKWHLGFCNVDCTPTRRGFDTFYGYYTGSEDYYTHVRDDGIDFHDNIKPIKPDGEYSAHQYAKRAESIIYDHDKSTPMFLYLPFQSVHAPIEVPKKYEEMYSHIKNKGRRQFSGMVSALDEAVGNVTKALKDTGMLQDTVILFTSDNGGMPIYYGNNYPLRGGKITVFEGGTRAAAFITGAGIQYSNYTYNGLIHAVDWYPTLIKIAGGDVDTEYMDGLDLWLFIKNILTPTPRFEFLYNLDDKYPYSTGHAAIRSNQWKLIDGYPGPFPFWYKPKTLEEDQDIKVAKPEDYADKVMLFNIEDDPTERNDLSKQNPDIVKQLQRRLDEYWKQMVPANYPKLDRKSDPKNFNGFWSPGWC